MKEIEPGMPTVDADVQVNGPESVEPLPALVTQKEMNERNERYWQQPGGTFPNNG